MPKTYKWRQCPKCDHYVLWGKECKFCLIDQINKDLDIEEKNHDSYWDYECVMCGKEGADIRSDGKNYCSTCWTVWNS